MFCPNCGTQNPDAAQTCSKCSFHLRSAAAPKFKGTMLMMNQPAPTPGVAAAAPVRPGAGGAAVPGAAAAPNRLKGTMMGVAPMAIGGMPFPPPPAPAPPAPGFSPSVPQAGVNPLGGTLAADAGVLGAFAVQQQGATGHAPYGAPPAPFEAAASPTPGGLPLPAAPMAPAYSGGTLAFGAPQALQPPFQSPAGQPRPDAPPYGAPPHNMYGSGEPYGAAPQQPPAFAMQAAQPYPSPDAMAPFGQPPAGPMVGTLKSSSGSSPVGPTRRNALLTMLLPLAVIFGGFFLSIILAFAVAPALGSLASLFVLAGWVWYVVLAVQMVNELKSVTRSEELAWWPIIVPIYQLYFMWFVVPQEVAKAKQMLGVRQPPQNVVLYIFLWHFALASDLNDMVR